MTELGCPTGCTIFLTLVTLNQLVVTAFKNLSYWTYLMKNTKITIRKHLLRINPLQVQPTQPEVVHHCNWTGKSLNFALCKRMQSLIWARMAVFEPYLSWTSSLVTAITRLGSSFLVISSRAFSGIMSGQKKKKEKFATFVTIESPVTVWMQ